MKNILKRFWPLLTLGVVAVGVLIGVWIYNARSTPKSAVEGYLRASLEYDADDLIKYASEYQRRELMDLYGIKDTDTLRRTLKSNYSLPGANRVTGSITLQSEVGQPILPGTEAFDRLLEKYAEKADPSKVNSFVRVKTRCSIEGGFTMNYDVYAVQCGRRWYYGFNA
ncbi:MAG: hypothetical protein J1E00_04370 [Oscillospiraceae bacterium]|nr:hypothetical protein [Oscillospiraceae bacterium]